jgi:hypothetical protein
MYEQDGVRFDSGGRESAALDFDPVEEKQESAPDEILPAVTVIEQKTEPAQQEPQSIDQMHWRHLKAMVEAYGEPWTNKESAIQFLRGK